MSFTPVSKGLLRDKTTIEPQLDWLGGVVMHYQNVQQDQNGEKCAEYLSYSHLTLGT